MDPFNDPAPAGRSTSTSTLTLASLLERLGEYDTEANGYVAICPSHTDTKPSLRVTYNSGDKKLALKCRAGCTIQEVLTSMDLKMADLFNVEPGDLDDVRSSGRSVEKPATGDLAALAFYLDKTTKVETGPAEEYAYRRFGITSEKFEELGLGFDDGSIDGGKLILSRAAYHDTPRLVVPFNDFDGHPHYLQARAIGLIDGIKAKWSGPNNPDGAAWAKYGFFSGGSGWNEVIITEGPGDALTATAVGYDVVLIRGAGLGSNAALADELAAGLQGRKVVVAGDADNAGGIFTRDVASALSSRKIDVHRLTLPADGGNDISKWRELAGTAFDKAFIKAVQESPKYGSDQITVETIAQDVTRLFSDVYNARTLLAVIQEQGADIRYTEEAGWMIYRPEVGVWQHDKHKWAVTVAQTVASRVQQAVLAQMQGMDLRVAGIEDKEAREKTGTLLDKMRAKARSGSLVTYVMSDRGIEAMVKMLQTLPGVPCDLSDFDKDKDKLAARNGVIDLTTGDVIPFSSKTKDMMITRRVDLDYLPGARNPRWERFVEEIFDDKDGRLSELPAYMQRLIGYGITGRTSEQCFVVMFGTGANGKSVFTDTLSTIFEGISATAAFETFEMSMGGNAPRGDIARLQAARLVMTEEGKQGAPMAESTLKLITGSGKVTSRKLYKGEFEYKPEFLLLMASNYRPNFRGQDEGLWRRVRLIPFVRYFAPADRDKYLAQKFAGEIVPTSSWREDDDMGDGPEGIFAWAVRGAIEWYARGLQDPEVVVKSTEDYKKASDALANFYAEKVVKDPTGRIAGKDVWELYRNWADEEGLAPKDRWKRATFWAALEERGAVKTNHHGSASFKGLRARRPSDPHEGDEPTTPEKKVATERAPEPDLAELPSDGIEAPSIDAFIP